MKKDILNRALKTFVQGFLASMIVSLNNATSVNETMLKSAILGAIAGGISAVMNMIIQYLDREEK
jgi:hypothetical protein